MNINWAQQRRFKNLACDNQQQEKNSEKYKKVNHKYVSCDQEI